MKFLSKVTAMNPLAVPAALALVLTVLCSTRVAAQDPVITPIIVDTAVNTAVPIIVNAVKPKPTGLAKFDGYVMNANVAQITVRAKGNDMAIQTFTLSQEAAAKMQQTIDKGGFQYGDKVSVLYDAGSQKAMKIKGKPSRAS
jgi:hypothetical protein